MSKISHQILYPQNLVKLQSKFYEPLITWFEGEFNAKLNIMTEESGIFGAAQPPETLDNVTQHLMKMTPYELAGGFFS